MDREKVIKGLYDIGGFVAERIGIEQARNYLRTIDDTVALLKEQEAVVRCKDCKKRDSWECWQYFFGRIKIPDDWYCADGERRTDDA